MSRQTQQEHTEATLQRVLRADDANKLAVEARVLADILNHYIILGKLCVAARGNDSLAQSSVFLARRRQRVVADAD